MQARMDLAVQKRCDAVDPDNVCIANSLFEVVYGKKEEIHKKKKKRSDVFFSFQKKKVDGFASKNGFGFTASDQLVYNRWLSQQAHQRNLSIGLKNDMDQASDLLNDFDFAINEQVTRTSSLYFSLY
jgi:hypothetical protein